MTDDDITLAAEFALGLLDPHEAEALALRVEHDQEFSALVAWWREQFSPLIDEHETSPPSDVWQRIEHALPQNDNMRQSLRRWRAAAVTAAAIAASLVAVVLLRPLPVPSQPQVMLAALKGTSGASATVAYDVTSGRLMILPGTIDTKGQDAELWVIPPDGTPRSLGVIDTNRATHPVVAANRRALIKAGATFAITLEPKGGSPTGLPTGPAISAGKISAT